MYEVNLSYIDFKNEVITNNLKHRRFTSGNTERLAAFDSSIVFTSILDADDLADYDAILAPRENKKLSEAVVLSPFADKGGNHFRGTGIKKTVAAGASENIDFEIPYNKCNYNGIEILNGAYGDKVQLQILDNATGTFSTVPNMVLDSFGIDWYMKKELTQILPYDATLYKTMIIRVVYENNTPESKIIYVNHYLHEAI